MTGIHSTTLALIIFALTFVAALAGIGLRSILPSHHLDGESRDAIKLVMGLIATITALVLGFLISSAHAVYDAEDAELHQLGINVYEVDRILAHFGPAAAPQRELLRHILASDLARIWPADAAPSEKDMKVPPSTLNDTSVLVEGVAALTPKNELEKFGQNRALQLLLNTAETRRIITEQAGGALAWPFLIVLVAWLVLLFFGFGLFARFNATVAAAFLIGAASVAGALFLILEMNQPFRGQMQLSSAPLRDALTQMTP